MAQSPRLHRFRRWVFWTGVFNILAYFPMVCPYTLNHFLVAVDTINRGLGWGGTPLVFPSDPTHLLLINLLGVFVVIVGILLVIAAHDIENRAWLVFWEGVIRIVTFLFILYFVVGKNAPGVLAGFGVIDLVIGGIYMYYIFSIQTLKIK